MDADKSIAANFNFIGGPDLRIEDFQLIPESRPRFYSFQAAISNLGNKDTYETFQVKVQMSTNNGVYNKWFTLDVSGGIKAGQSRTIDAGLIPIHSSGFGWYYVRVYLDSTNRVAELFEDNNFKEKEMSIRNTWDPAFYRKTFY